MTTDHAVSDDAVEAALKAYEAEPYTQPGEDPETADSERRWMRAALRAASPFLAGDGVTIKLTIPEPPLFNYRDSADFKWLPVALNGVTGVSDYVVLLPSGREHFIAKEDFEALQPMSTLSAPPPQPEVAELLSALEAPIEVLGTNSEDAWEKYDPLRLQAAKCIRSLTAEPQPEVAGLVEAVISSARSVIGYLPDPPAIIHVEKLFHALEAYDAATAALASMDGGPK